MKLNVWMLCLASCLAVAASVNAQQPGGRGRGGMGGFMAMRTIIGFAGNEAVQKDLGLSTDEVGKVKEVTDEFTKALSDATEGLGGRNMSQEDRDKMNAATKTTTEKFVPKLKKVLTADQFTRLQQIHWQSQGAVALTEPEVSKALALTSAQTDKIKSLTDEYAVKIREARGGGGGGGGGGFERMQEITKERDAKGTEILTKDQQDKFASLKGKEFDLAQMYGGGRGGRGGGGGGGGNAKRPQPKAE